mmetsp:Transcript_794/g.1727  ORF Transcript_794/g.1727 Transcript_794/m.1727 type:complete len:104 (+) Transcript_794:702-1013(+)
MLALHAKNESCVVMPMTIGVMELAYATCSALCAAASCWLAGDAVRYYCMRCSYGVPDHFEHSSERAGPLLEFFFHVVPKEGLRVFCNGTVVLLYWYYCCTELA